MFAKQYYIKEQGAMGGAWGAYDQEMCRAAFSLELSSFCQSMYLCSSDGVIDQLQKINAQFWWA